MMELHITLKAWRINSGLTKREVANRLGKDEKTIYNWENGIGAPDKSNLEKLADIYKTDSDFIFLADKHALSEHYQKFI